MFCFCIMVPSNVVEHPRIKDCYFKSVMLKLIHFVQYDTYTLLFTEYTSWQNL